MRRAGFTLVELLVSMLILGVVTSLSVLTFNAITMAWTVSTEYLDKMQRSDYALEQVVSGLKSMYYPHAGEQDYTYGFYLTDNGTGEDPRSSDVIEWAKIGPAIVGNQSASVDTVHRVQLMVLEEGNRDYRDPIEVTGLYARMCPDPALRPKSDKESKDIDYSFANDDMYQPMLVVDGIVGFNCRVMKDADQADADASKAKFEDEWVTSNAVPYKVELTFWIADPEGRSYRTNTAPVMRIVRIPVFDQSQDGAALPSEEKKAEATGRGGTGGGNRRPAGGAAGGAGGGAAGGNGATGGGRPGPGGNRPGAGGPSLGGGRPAGGMGGAGIGGGRPAGGMGGGSFGGGGR